MPAACPAGRNRFTHFMAGGGGRILRIALGTALLMAGLGFVGGATGYAIAALGLLPIASGALNLCPVAPL